MSELFKIVLTSCLTILGGIIVLVIGQIITKFFIEPIHEQSKLIGDIAYSLTFYANIFSNPGNGKPEQMEEASKILRQQASQLLEKNYTIQWYWLWELLRVVPKQEDVIAASQSLIWLSNFIYSQEIDPGQSIGSINKIKNRLRIKIEQ